MCNLCKLCLLAVCFCCPANALFLNSKSTVKKKELPKFEQVFPDGTVFPSPFFQSQRNWTEYKKAVEKYTKSLKQRVVGGRESTKGEVPYFAIFTIKGIDLPWCGGAIYNKNTILTAAHCLYYDGKPLGPYSCEVIVGEYDMSRNETTEKNIEISKLIPHKCFKINDVQYYDIAVVKLMKPLKYNKYIQPIRIPQRPTKFQGEMTVSGFGYTRKRKAGSATPANGFSSILKVTNLTILSRSKCKMAYEGTSVDAYQLVKHKSAFCAGGIEDDDKVDKMPVYNKFGLFSDGEVTDACQGDSGGPAVCYATDNKKYLCGLVSTGIGCGMTGFPGIFAKVYRLRHWIKENAGEGDQPTIDY